MKAWLARGALPALLLLVSPLVQAAPSVPAFSDAVVDTAGLLSESQRETLAASLRDFQRRVGPQLAVLIIPSLEGEPIEGYSIRVVETWKLGDAKRDDGVLLLIAARDRQLRIEVGQGLEGTVPDAIAGRIIRDVIVPRLKEGLAYDGIADGLGAIAQRLGGELGSLPRTERSYARRGRGTGIGALLFLLIIILTIIQRLLGGGPRLYRRRHGWSDLATGAIIGSSSRHSGWGGGGGFSGGGGGGFSGGGASGRW